MSAQRRTFIRHLQSVACSSQVSIRAKGSMAATLALVSILLALALGLLCGPALAQSGPQLSMFTLKPTTIVGGDTSIGTVVLSDPAPTGGITVRLSSSSPSATVPVSVLVPSGQSQATFTLHSRSVSASTSVSISATYSSTLKTATLTVTPAGMNPKVPQGDSTSFRSRGTEKPAPGVTWDVLRGSTPVASNVRPNGWTVSYDTANPSFTLGAPNTATPALNYKVRYGLGASYYSASFDVVPGRVGIVGSPPVPWAEEVRPIDTVGGGGFGPSAADSVDLATGVGENRPGPDMVVRNPVGPDAVYARMYRSSRAVEGYASPGLSPGWTDNFDVTIQRTSAAGTWGALQITYPNGATETFTPVLTAGGMPTGRLTEPTGAPYLVTGVPAAAIGHWRALQITFRDESSWTFLPDPRNPDRYLLSRIANLLGHYIAINYDALGRLRTITDDAPRPNVLFSFTYDGNGRLLFLRDIYGRQVRFTFGSAAGTTCLLAVSQMSLGGFFGGHFAAPRWQYRYTATRRQGQPHRLPLR